MARGLPSPRPASVRMMRLVPSCPTMTPFDASADWRALSRADADRILQRAVELEGDDSGGSLTPDELRSAAAQAGIDLEAVERAIAEVREEAWKGRRSGEGDRETTVLEERVVPVKLSGRELGWMIHLLNRLDEAGDDVRWEDGLLTWRRKDGVTVAIRPGPRGTHISVERAGLGTEAIAVPLLFGAAGGVWSLLVMGGLFDSDPALAAAVGGLVGLLGSWGVWRVRLDTARRRVNELASRLTDVVSLLRERPALPDDE